MLKFSSSSTAICDSASKQLLTGAALTEKIGQFAEHITGPGKSLVFCFCANDISSVISYLAALSSGQAIALFDANLNTEQKSNLVAAYQPEFVVDSKSNASASSTYAGYELIQSSLPDLPVLSLKSGSGTSIHPDLGVLLPTSGTTGSPKLVRLSYGNLEANARSICTVLKIGQSDRPIMNLPMHYSYGLSVLNTHLLAGATVILTNENILSERFWQVVRDHECTSFAGVPYAYEILQRLDLEQLCVPRLKKFTQAGGKLNSSLVEKFDKLIKARGGEFFVMYGQTEATARITVLPPDRLSEKLGSVGVAIPGGSLCVKRGTTSVSPDSPGEIIYSGANVMMGYANARKDLALGDELGGTLHTGDLGYLDQEGYLYITGRLKRIAKVLGYRINLDEIELLLAKFFPAAVISDDQRIIVFCEGGDNKAFEASRQYLVDQLHLNPSIFDFRIVEKLPKTSNDKIEYSRLQTNVK